MKRHPQIINGYVKIESYCDIEVIDYNQLMEQEVFRMNYSDEISADNIIYSFDEWTESYKIVSIYTMSNDLQIPNYYNNYPVQTIDQAAFKQVINLGEISFTKDSYFYTKRSFNRYVKLEVFIFTIYWFKIK